MLSEISLDTFFIILFLMLRPTTSKDELAAIYKKCELTSHLPECKVNCVIEDPQHIGIYFSFDRAYNSAKLDYNIQVLKSNGRYFTFVEGTKLDLCNAIENHVPAYLSFIKEMLNDTNVAKVPRRCPFQPGEYYLKRIHVNSNNFRLLPYEVKYQINAVTYVTNDLGEDAKSATLKMEGHIAYRFDCKEVQCPPDVECPADSVLRVIYEPQKFDDETKNTINSGSINKIDKRTDHSRRHTKFIVEKSEELIDDHEVVKRSLQYKRRESIKIVPGDYISFVPESVHLHSHQLNQNQHKWKRDAEGEDTTIVSPTTKSPIITTTTISTTSSIPPPQKPGIKECCANKTCVCTGHCPAPRCSQSDLVPHEVGSSSNIPGKCCPKHICAPEPKCTNTTTSEFFWPNKCKKCKCVGEHRLCHDACEEDVQDRQCFSPTQQRPFLSGVTWQEDECTMCECKDGDMKCQTSFCRPLDCPKQVKLPGDCCKVCVAQEPTTTLTTPTDIIETTTSTTEATEPITTTIVTTTSTTTQATTMTTPTTTTPAPTTTTIATTTVPPPSPSTKPTISTTLVQTQPPNTTPAPVIITSSVLPPVQQVPQTAPPTPPECITPTVSTTKATMFLPADHFKFLETSAETIILYVVIVILLVICCIFVGLYVHELTKRTTYSSIPSSDSNLSQMPRPKTESA